MHDFVRSSWAEQSLELQMLSSVTIHCTVNEIDWISQVESFYVFTVSYLFKIVLRFSTVGVVVQTL